RGRSPPRYPRPADSWADPAKQQVPKAWKTMSLTDKTAAIRAYTKESVERLKRANLTLGMVSIGNETTNGFAGETKIANITALMAAASEEIRKASPETLISVHYTNPESVNYSNLAFQLAIANVDYDVFSTSYYAYWHGTLENLRSKLGEIAKSYGKKVMVAETQWAYTTLDSDFSGNTIGETVNYDKPYAFSVQGQANMIRDVVDTISGIEGNAGIGVFYWEPAWIRVPADTYEDSLKLWEKYGSGWASSYASEYDPDDAGKYYGGSACDNQALFGPDGKPLESLKVFSLLRSGNEVENRVDTAENALIEVKLNNEIVLPETVDCLMYDNTVKQLPVVWDVTEERLKEMSASPVGLYEISGVSEGKNVTLTVKMVEENYVENYSFEKEDRSVWVIENIAGGDQTDYQNKALDAFSGDYSLHFWNAEKVGFDVSQTITGLKEGSYTFSIEAQGGDVKEGALLYIYALSDGREYRQTFDLTGWKDFKNPTISGITVGSGTVKIGAHIEANGGA
ncbi:MAG: glycosyl hydrolase 53 family protein, partial [Lachnospiraceae bacterium]|nr:glycosyl hydrolase 53 family protein [Lachnospiraceae bacterium]